MEDKKDSGRFPWNEDDKSLGYRLGQMLCGVLVICLAALVVAMTIKIIFWMF